MQEINVTYELSISNIKGFVIAFLVFSGEQATKAGLVIKWMKNPEKIIVGK